MSSAPLLSADTKANYGEATAAAEPSIHRAVHRPHVLPYSARTWGQLRDTSPRWKGTLVASALLAVVVLTVVAAAVAR